MEWDVLDAGDAMGWSKREGHRMMNSCELPAKKGDVHPEKLGCQAKNSIAKTVV
jgi:hypothetical protein